jgi:hypothetical protein
MTDQPTETKVTTTKASTPTSAVAPTKASTKGKRGKAGRPSLDDAQKGGKASPQIAFRVNSAVRSKAQEVAEKEGLNVSQLGRKALKEYLSKH